MQPENCALLSDLDGTLSDTQSLWSGINADVLSTKGIHITHEEMTRICHGVVAQDWLPPLAKEHGVMIDIEQTIKECVEAFELRCADAPEIPGATDLIRNAYASKIPLAIASGSLPHLIEKILASLSLRSYFTVITSSAEVPRGKPEPDVFLLAAERLNINPRYCVVLEDGKAGMIAARSAGMKCIGYVPIGDGSGYPADVIVRSLSEVTPELILKLARA